MLIESVAPEAFRLATREKLRKLSIFSVVAALFINGTMKSWKINGGAAFTSASFNAVTAAKFAPLSLG
jgi:hypothetical protein